MRRLRLILGLAAVSSGCVGAALVPTARAGAAAASGSDAACRDGEPAVSWQGVLADERAEQDAWCAAVGAPVLVDNVAAPVQLDSLLIVSWNVKVGGGDVGALIERLRSGTLTGGATVPHFVLLLQEAVRAGPAVPAATPGMRIPRGIDTRPPGGDRRGIDELARAHGLSLAYVPSMRNGGRGREDRGNAILSTLPLRDVVAIELPLVRQRRVVVAATIDAQTTSGVPWSLQLASVHLENRPSLGVTGTSGRRAQMARLLEVLPAAPLAVMGGDLNTWASGGREPAVALARAQHPESGPALREATFDGPLFFDWQLDFLFARLPGGRATGAQRIADRFGSDHHAVMSWLHLPQAGGS